MYDFAHHNPSTVVDAMMALLIGDTQVRHRGTLGGSLANNDPSACYPVALLALGATIVTNVRRMATDDWFRSMFATALAPDELIAAIEFPIPQRSNYERFRNAASRYAMIGVFMASGPAGVRAATTGAGQDGVFRHAAMERALAADWSGKAMRGIDTPADGLNGDMHASVPCRAHLIGVMAQRAVARS